MIGIHDGVRPFVSLEVISACFTMAGQFGTAIPVLPMVESIRKGSMEHSVPVDRNVYFSVQTPQVFQFDILQKAYNQPYSLLFTDDASVVEAMGNKVRLVLGNKENIKLTTPFDLLIAEALFAQSS